MSAPARGPLRVAVINDHELIIQGVAAMLEPYADVVRVVELDAGTTVAQPVDIALYDTYARTGFDGDDLDAVSYTHLRAHET